MSGVVPDYVLPSKRLARLIEVDGGEVIGLANALRTLEPGSSGWIEVVAALKMRALEQAIERLPSGYTAKMMGDAVRHVARVMKSHFNGVVPDDMIAESFGSLETFGLRKKA